MTMQQKQRTHTMMKRKLIDGLKFQIFFDDLQIKTLTEYKIKNLLKCYTKTMQINLSTA